MFAVIFEVTPRPEKFDGYLDIARMLRPELERIDGFVENTRFRSRTRDGLLLSLSFWRDEKAVIRWRTHAAHHAGQARGRKEILAGYRLRVGEVAYATDAAGAALGLPAHRFDATEVGDAKGIVFHLARGEPSALAPAPSAIDHDLFDGVVDAADTARMETFAREGDAVRRAESGVGRRAAVRVIRDYGLVDRREAPQFHDPVG